MIRIFVSKETEALYIGKHVKRWQALVKQIEKRLQMLDSATCLKDLRYLPSNRLEALSGDRKNQYSISINNQWRIYP